jgi:hypothetical protein
VTGYWIEVVSSRARLAGPVVLLTSLLHVISSTRWVGSWSENVQATTNSFALVVPLLTACAALDVDRGFRPRDVLNIGRAGQPAWKVLLIRMSATMTWVLMAFGVVLATTGAINLGRTSFQAYPWLMLIVSVLGVVANVSVGFVLGRFLPGLAAIPLALFLTYGINIYLATSTGRPSALFTIIDDGAIPVGYQIRPGVALAQAVWFIAVAVGSAALLIASTRSWRSRPAGRAGAAALLLVALVMATGLNLANQRGERAELIQESGPRACDPGRTVCLWQDHGYLVPMTTAVAGRMLDPSTGWGDGPFPLVELGLVDDRPDTVLVSFGNNRPTEYDIARSIATGVIGERMCSSGEPPLSADLLAREEWLTLRGLAGPVAESTIGEEVRKVRSLPATEQWAWYREFSC